MHAEIAGWRSGPCRSLTDAAEETPAYIAVSASERGRDAHRTLQVLDEMQLNLQPDVIANNAAISACGKGQQPGMALELLDGMQRSGLEPDTLTYKANLARPWNSLTEKGAARHVNPT